MKTGPFLMPGHFRPDAEDQSPLADVINREMQSEFAGFTQIPSNGLQLEDEGALRLFTIDKMITACCSFF